MKEEIDLEKIIHCGKECPGECCLMCPQCGSGNVHPISVRVTRKTDKTEINSKGILTTEADENEPSRRGVIIELEYACESLHRGILKFEFYKGNTFVTHEKLEDFDSNSTWKTIWRD